jgi:hypothetical protein
MGIFVDAMLGSFPAGIAVPAPLAQFFQWIEDNGLHRNFDGEGYRYALVDPAAEETCISIVPVDPDFSKAWLDRRDPNAHIRLAPFCRTGGDGSHAALWIDDDGAVQIVHVGSGSGSVMIGVMVDDPVDFLRLLAIGYDELCWGEVHGLTPDQVVAAEHPDIDDYDEEELEDVSYPVPHTALAEWVSATFGVSIPATASEIVPALPSMDAKQSDDPFWKWVRSLRV